MNAHRVLSIAIVLAKSQLRAGRSGRGGERLFRNPVILAIIDAVCLAVTAGIGLAVSSSLTLIPEPFYSRVITAVQQGLVFVPALIPSAVLVAGVLFELSSSSKFASSDAVNWLPVSQSEYVTASALSVAYAYSIIPSIVLGFMLGPALALGYGLLWLQMAALSFVALFYAGATVEIVRAAINRVSSAVMKRARRGALVLRLVLMITVILILQVIFNFVFLLDIINAFASSLNLISFIPIFWASLAIRAMMAGESAASLAYSGGTLLFAAFTLWAAVRVRSRYWSPSPSGVVVTVTKYAPGRSRLRSLGLTAGEAALVRKDLRGLVRRRELLQYFAIPFVLAVVFLIQIFFNPASGQAPSFVSQLPVWFVGGIFGLIVSSISFGQEGRSVMLLYSLPIRPGEVLRAKVFSSLLLALVASMCMFTVVTVVAPAPLVTVASNLAIALAITVEEVCIGLAFGARFPDFQDRPRPRFVDPIGIIVMVLIGIGVMLVTAIPVIVGDIAVATAPGPGSAAPPYLFLSSLVFAGAVIALTSRWAVRETRRLFAEFRW